MAESSQKLENKTILKGSGVVGILTLLSRICGFFRDLVFATLFGSSIYADAFFVAFKIPNMLRSFVAEGALTSAFVPIFAGEVKKGSKETNEAFKQVWGFLFLVTIFLSILGVVFSKEITLFFAPGFEVIKGKLPLANSLTKIMIPYVIFISFVSLSNGALSVFKIFGMSAISQILMNIVMVVFAIVGLCFTQYQASHIVAWSVVVSGILMCIIQIPSLKKVGLSIIPSFKIFNKTIYTLIKLMFPAIVGAGVYQLTIFINTVLASMLEAGSVSWLFYADRFAQIPIGIFTISLASVLLPSLSKFVVNNQKKEFHESLQNALRYTSFITIPVSFFIFLIAELAIKIFLQRGAFNDLSTTNTASALKAYCIGIWGISCYTILIRGFLARKDTKTPTILSGLILFFHFHISLLLCGQLVEGTSFSSSLLFSYQQFLYSHFNFLDIGHVGLALSGSISSSIGFALLLIVFKRRNHEAIYSNFFVATIKAFVASSMMYILAKIPYQYEINVYIKLILVTGLACIGYFLGMLLLRSKEFFEILSFVKNKVKTKKINCLK